MAVVKNKAHCELPSSLDDHGLHSSYGSATLRGATDVRMYFKYKSLAGKQRLSYSELFECTLCRHQAASLPITQRPLTGTAEPLSQRTQMAHEKSFTRFRLTMAPSAESKLNTSVFSEVALQKSTTKFVLRNVFDNSCV